MSARGGTRDGVRSGECLRTPGDAPVRGKKIGRIELRFDEEFRQALELLQSFYSDTAKAEIIRVAVIEKAKREAAKRGKSTP